MKEIRYCPNCVTEMNKEKVVRGLVCKPYTTYLYKCPKCGVVEDANEPQDCAVIKTNNDDKEQYYDCSEDNIIYDYIQQKDPS